MLMEHGVLELAVHVPVMGFLGSIGWPELLVLGLLGVLIFGRRLPEVGRNLGRSLVEFKQGLKGVEDEVQEIASPLRELDAKVHTATSTTNRPRDRARASRPEHRQTANPHAAHPKG